MKYEFGLIVGKFYPPHEGHLYLIDTALSQCEKLTIFVVFESKQDPAPYQRLNWLKKIYAYSPNVTIKLVANLVGRDDDSDAWARYAIHKLGYTPDAVFTSEDYGEPWAKAMGCAHVSVDPDRLDFPISGTEVRENLYTHWDYLPDVVREDYVFRVCIVGGESTGKSTLTRNLAEHYATTYTEEAGRRYVEIAGLNKEDLGIWDYIVEEQPKYEQRAIRESPVGLIFCDTDLLTTRVWYEHWVPPNSELHDTKIYNKIIDESYKTRYGLYLLLWHDVPWVQDENNSRSELEHREKFTNHLLYLLKLRNANFVIIDGDNFDDRTKQAIAAVDNYLGELDAKGIHIF